LALVFFAELAHAGFDASVSGSYRAYPLSGVAETTVGYGHLLWGSEKNALYGFVRASADFDAITQYQSTGVRIEIFPISILGARAGQTWQQNHQDLSSYDCAANVCRGFFTDQYIEGQIYLGWGPIKFSASSRATSKSASSESNPNAVSYFVDPESGLQFSNSQTDHLNRVRGVLAYELSQNLRFGLNYTGFASDLTHETSHMDLGFVQATWGPLAVVLAGGDYSASFGSHTSTMTSPAHSTFVGYAQWTFLPKLGY
jgi:hypothetical protein